MPEDLFEVSVLVRLARGADLLASIGLFGTLLYTWAIALPALVEAGEKTRWRGGVRKTVLVLLAVKVASSLLWLFGQALAMAGDDGAIGWSAISQVATGTLFGRALIARVVLFAAAVVVAGLLQSGWRVALATVLAGLSLALLIEQGHAAATDDIVLPLLIAVHVIAAGAWLGALVPLLLFVHLFPDSAAIAARRFSGLGLVAVVALFATAWVQSLYLIGDVGGWFGTTYGIVAIGKTVLFALLLLIAAANRFILTPKLEGARASRTALLISIGIETAVALVLVAAAVVLATLPPGKHLQPQWPFSFQPDFSNIHIWYYGRELWRVAILAAAVVIAVLCLFFRRTRIAGPVLAAIVVFATPWPNLRVLAKPAYPTSFYRSPTGYAASSIARGEEIVRANCVPECFRDELDPTDLSSYNLWRRSDGDLFSWLVDVFDVKGFSPVPHGTIAALTERQRWFLIDYFRARSTGFAVRGRQDWPYPVPAPRFDSVCGDGSTRTIADLRGNVIHIVAATGDAPVTLPPPPAGIGLRTVVLTDQDSIALDAPDVCFSSSPDAWRAFAVVTHEDDAGLNGTSVLLDANGWLRLRAPTTRLLADEDFWRDTVTTLSKEPIPGDAGAGHKH